GANGLLLIWWIKTFISHFRYISTNCTAVESFSENTQVRLQKIPLKLEHC
ncbi:ubiquitin-conjugating enzyme E2 1, partial [Trichinella spiralis]